MAAAHDPEMARIDIGTMLSEVWRRKWRIVGVTIALMALTYIALIFVPKMYESSASLLVGSRDTTFTKASTDTSSSSGGSSDDMAIASQVELVQSRDTLLKVIDSLDLRDVPELSTASPGLVGTVLGLFGQAPPPPKDVTATVLANLDKRLTVIRERDSRVVSILFRSENPELAAKVANAIAAAHVNRRAGLEISDTADASKWLETEIDKMREKVAAADAAVANFRIENDLYNGKDGTSSLVDQQLSDIATQITQSQERESTARARSTVLLGLIQQGKPIDSVPAVQDSAVISALAQQRSELQGRKAELLARLLSSHPDVEAVTAQIREIDKQMTGEGRRIADALQSEADIEAGIQQSLRDKLALLKVTASTDLTNGVSLSELEREAKAQRELLENYLVRYRDASARTDITSALPDVRIVTEAAPSYEPASPKTSLILIAVLVVSLAGQIGYILFVELASGRAVIAGDGDWDDVEHEDVVMAEPEAPEPHELDDEPEAEPARVESDEMEEHPMPGMPAKPRHPAADDAGLPAAPGQVAREPVFASQAVDERSEPEPVHATRIVSRFADLLNRVPRASNSRPDEVVAADGAGEEPQLSEPMTGLGAVLDPVAAVADESEPARQVPKARPHWAPPPDWESRMAAAGVRSEPEKPKANAPTPIFAKSARSAAESGAETEAPAETAELASMPVTEPAPTPEAPATSEPSAPSPAAAASAAPVPAAASAEPQATATAVSKAPVSDHVSETGYVPRHAEGEAPNRPQAKRLPETLKPLVNAIATGRERIVLVSGLGDPSFSAGIIEQIGAACAALGLGVATIDAASGRTGNSAGLGDLLAGAASFGDVVHADRGSHLARVPWGQKPKLDVRSSQGVTLAEALSDIYNVVLISTGLPGPGSSLPVFAGLDGYILLASALPVDEAALSGFEAGAGALGFKRVQVVSAADGDMQVA